MFLMTLLDLVEDSNQLVWIFHTSLELLTWVYNNEERF